MPYEIILGREEKQREKFGLAGTVFIGKQYVKMGQVTALAQPIYLDLNKAHVLFVCGKRGCLTGETKIYTSNGFKEIKNFDQEKDLVWSFDANKKKFEWCKATLLKYPIFNEKLIKIELRDGQTLILTKEHPLLIKEKNKFVWKKAQELKIGDIIVSTQQVPEVKNDSKSLRIARLLGFILASGNFNERGKWLDGIKIFSTNSKIISQAQKDFNEEFNIVPERYKRNDCNCRVLEIQHQKVIDAFLKLDAPSDGKTIPEIVWTHSNKFKAEFLKALFSSNGLVSKKNNKKNNLRISYSSSSIEFLKDLQLLLLFLNIRSRIRTKKAKGNKTYFLEITDWKSLKNWKNKIGFIDEEKNKLLASYSSYSFWRRQRREKTKRFEKNLYGNKIKSISFIEGIKTVYDLQVNGPHSFIANGIISHNSGKSYCMGVIAEGIAMLPEEQKKKLSVIILDTMGIYWSMRFPNHKDADLLREWGLEGKGFIKECKIYTPIGFFEEYKAKGIPTDAPFAIHPGELTPEDWWLSFELEPTNPIAIFISRAISELKKDRGNDYDIEDILKKFEELEEEPQVKRAAISRFKAAAAWGLFSKEATPIRELAKGGQITILDLSAYMAVPAGWRIKHLALGIVCRKLFIERMIVRKDEEYSSIHKAIHYIVAEHEEPKGYEMPIVWIAIDEAHEFLPAEGKTAATEALITLLREGRQPGIALILATQQPGKIHTDAMTQADIILAHRLTAKIDIDALGNLMQEYFRGKLDQMITELPKVAGACLAVDDVNERMFPMRIRPRVSWHGGGAPEIIKEEKPIFGL